MTQILSRDPIVNFVHFSANVASNKYICYQVCEKELIEELKERVSFSSLTQGGGKKGRSNRLNDRIKAYCYDKFLVRLLSLVDGQLPKSKDRNYFASGYMKHVFPTAGQ